jgi:hypothetical protein
MLLADAARHNLDVDDELRDRLALWATDLAGIVSLVDELRSSILQPA